MKQPRPRASAPPVRPRQAGPRRPAFVWGPGPAGDSVARGRPSPRPANLRLLPSRRAAPVPREHGRGAGHGVRRRRRGKRKMAAGKSGGGAGQAAFLEGAFAVGELRGGWGVGGNSRHRGPSGRGTQLCAPGGPGSARRSRVVDGGRPEFGSPRQGLGQAGARRRGSRAASRGLGRPGEGHAEGSD